MNTVFCKRRVTGLLEILFIAIASCLIACAFTVESNALQYNGFEYVVVDNKAKILEYTGRNLMLDIPSEIDGFTVTAIADNAFQGKTIRSCKIPDTVENIGAYAFRGCAYLQSITFPESVKSIGEGALSQSGIESLVLPSSIEVLPESLCYNCKELTSIRIPSTVEIIPDNFCKDCINLQSIRFNEGLIEIGNSAFQGCESLRSIIIPASVTIIKDDAFNGCSSTKSVGFSEESKIKTLGNRAFRYCNMQYVYLPKTITGDCYAFGNNNNLRWIIVPDGVNRLMLNDCGKLEECVIPSTVSSVKLYGLTNTVFKVPSGSVAEAECKNSRLSYAIDSSADSDIQVIYNDKRISFHEYGQNPTIINSRTMVPLRSIFERMGATVNWNNETRTVTASRNDKNITVEIDSNIMIVNGKKIKLDSPATIRNGRTLVPVRAIAEAFGAKVIWNSNARFVFIDE